MTTATPPRRTTIVKVLLGGKVRLIRQNANPMLYARAYVQGRYIAHRTGEVIETRATEVAERWFYDLQHRIASGEQLHEPTLGLVVRKFLADSSVKAQVSQGQARNYSKKWSVLEPLLAAVRCSAVTTKFLEEFRTTRAGVTTRFGTPLTANTIDKDIIFIRQVLRWGTLQGLVKTPVPDAPRKTGRFSVIKRGRPYLDLDQWRTLTLAARTRAVAQDARRARNNKHPTRGRPIDPERQWELYCFILIAAGGALRTGEAYSLRWMDCDLTTVKTPEGSTEPTVRVRVLGKHSRGGVREDGWVLFGGVEAFKLLRKRRPNAPPNEPLFRYNHEAGFRELLRSLELYDDPKTGMTRNTKSLRVTGLCLRLHKNPSVSLNDLRKWARTSVVQIEKFYDQLTPELSAGRVAGGGTKRKSRRSRSSAR